MTSIRETAEKFNIDGNFNGRVLLSEPMAPHTTFKVGGNAALFIEPSDTQSLVSSLRTLRESGIPYFILGGGSNIVVSDRGFSGAVISMCGMNKVSFKHAPCVSSLESEGAEIVEVEAGAAMASAVNFCTENCLSGMETFAGLPGTVGGALFMNARCFDVSVSGVLSGAEYINPDTLENVLYEFNASDWDYKKSPFQNTDRIITKAFFRLSRRAESEKPAIAEKCRGFVNERVEKGHFRFPSAGSVFRNNHDFGKPSGKIIDEAGLRGYTVGGAQIAPWHGNFIINVNRASSADIRSLTDYIIQEVRKKTGFTLVPEIIFCGD